MPILSKTHLINIKIKYIALKKRNNKFMNGINVTKWTKSSEYKEPL